MRNGVQVTRRRPNSIFAEPGHSHLAPLPTGTVSGLPHLLIVKPVPRNRADRPTRRSNFLTPQIQDMRQPTRALIS